MRKSPAPTPAALDLCICPGMRIWIALLSVAPGFYLLEEKDNGDKTECCVCSLGATGGLMQAVPPQGLFPGSCPTHRLLGRPADMITQARTTSYAPNLLLFEPDLPVHFWTSLLLPKVWQPLSPFPAKFAKVHVSDLSTKGLSSPWKSAHVVVSHPKLSEGLEKSCDFADDLESPPLHDKLTL